MDNTTDTSTEARLLDLIRSSPGAPLTGVARKYAHREIQRRYEQGQGMREIGEHFGRSYGFVNRVITRELGITPRGRGGARRKGASRGRRTN